MRLGSWLFEIVDCCVVEPLETGDCDQLASRVFDLPNRVSAISGGPSVSQANNRGACSRVRDVYRWRVVVHLILGVKTRPLPPTCRSVLGPCYGCAGGMCGAVGGNYCGDQILIASLSSHRLGSWAFGSSAEMKVFARSR